MKNIFNPDSALLRFITKITYSAYLNILWFICCIPIVTVGASTTALFYVTLKIARDEEGSLTKQFFHSFKENFKQATKIWMILLVVGIFLATDGYVLYHIRFENAFWTICTAILIAITIIYAIILMYIFPLLSRFDNSVKAMFVNSFLLGVRYLFCTILMAAIYFIMAVVIINFFTPLIMFGHGICALLCSFLLVNIFEKLQEDGEKAEEAAIAEAEADSSIIPEEHALETLKNPDSQAARKISAENMPRTYSCDAEKGTKTYNPKEERKKRREEFRNLKGTAKMRYLFDYYKFPFVVGCILIFIACNIIFSFFTRKHIVLYTAFVNVSTGDTLTEQLSRDYLENQQYNSKENKVYLYQGLYLTDDTSSENFEYTYASQTKILGAINAKQLDIVIMDKEAFDAFSQNNYLWDLDELLADSDPNLHNQLDSSLITNLIILSDNAKEAAWNPSVEYTAETKEARVGIDISGAKYIAEAGFSEPVYLGIIKNTERKSEAIAYLRYLFQA